MYKYKSFIFITLAWAYIFYGLNILLKGGIHNWWGVLLIALGGISPALTTMILIFKKASIPERKEFLRNMLSFKSIPFKGWLIIIFLPMLVLHSAIGLSLLINPGKPAYTLAYDFSASVLSIIPFALMVLIIGPIPEETGWRGYLLNALLNRFNLLNSSLIIAVVWGLWHVPLFFIEGYPLAEKLNSPCEMFAYFALLFPISIVYSKLFVLSGKSIPSVILFHFFINFYGMIWDTSAIAQYMELMIWLGIAAYIIIRD